MIKRFCKWYLSSYLWDVYNDGWTDGVDQQRVFPESTLHHVTLDNNGEPWSEEE
jgi:hypothetical protein